jgi:hypothetical protein
LVPSPTCRQRGGEMHGQGVDPLELTGSFVSEGLEHGDLTA